MNESFVEYLNTISPNQEIILVATRAFISELTDDLLPSKMKEKLISVTANREELERGILNLEESAQECLDVCMDFLSWAWGDQTNRKSIQAAFDGAAAKLPAIEAGLAALVAMYAMYLIATGGLRKKTHTIRQRKDGTFDEIVSIEYETPTGPLSLVSKFFEINGKGGGSQ